MLRRLLESRFALKHRVETRELPVYELRRARQDGSLGPHLTPFGGECFRPANQQEVANPAGTLCRFSVSPGVARAVGTDWEDLSLASNLTELDRLVIDKRGLTGKFNVTMQWSPDASGSRPEEVSLFTALREQLGLKLEPTTGAVKVIVVDDARLPDPD